MNPFGVPQFGHLICAILIFVAIYFEILKRYKKKEQKKLTDYQGGIR